MHDFSYEFGKALVMVFIILPIGCCPGVLGDACRGTEPERSCRYALCRRDAHPREQPASLTGFVRHRGGCDRLAVAASSECAAANKQWYNSRC
jgi:hypothetical protein